MKSILDIFTTDKSLSDEIVKTIQLHIPVKSVKKGTILQREGDISTFSYFVKSGLLRSYVIDEKGKEHIFMFAPEGWIISDIVSQIENVPSELFIDVLEDSMIEILDKDFFDNFNALATKNGKEIITSLFKRNAVLQKRVILLMSALASKRYLQFIETYPSIVQRVPLKMIASYLGITPEALSKIRTEISKKK